MGMYTELNMAVELVNNQQVIDILNYMLGEIEEKPEIPNHALFGTDRWEWMLRSDSYYFDGQTDSRLFVDNLYENKPMYFLNVRCNLKNYNNEIEEFLDWICPYCVTNGFIGYKRYEECKNPTLIYITDKGIEYK